jgi:hypothetical protein
VEYIEMKEMMKGSIGNKYLGRKELKELPSILWENETPKHIVHGIYESGSGVLVATDLRLIFIDKGIFSLKVEDFPYDKITSIQYSTGILMGEIIIYASGNKAKITHIEKDLVRPFADWVRNYINTGANEDAETVEVTTEENKPSQIQRTELIIKQLKELAELKNQGILTEEEFQAQKAKILE